MEVLRPEDLKKEVEGIDQEGIMWYPRARPVRMLRIFRTRFSSLQEAQKEIQRVKLIQRYLSPDFVAHSEEFLVDYKTNSTYETVLCGLQTYVEGEILDPWAPMDQFMIEDLFRRMSPLNASQTKQSLAPLLQKAREQLINFVAKIKQMIIEAHHIPDLAGVGNLLLTPEPKIVLVDINNISTVSFDGEIPLDDRGYPVCDKSIEALFLLEQKATTHPVKIEGSLYEIFLNPHRMRKVRAFERRFHLAGLGGPGYPIGTQGQT